MLIIVIQGKSKQLQMAAGTMAHAHLSPMLIILVFWLIQNTKLCDLKDKANKSQVLTVNTSNFLSLSVMLNPWVHSFLLMISVLYLKHT